MFLKARSAFLERLSALGYVERKNIVIEELSAEGHAERLGELAREIVASKVDVIVTPSVPASTAVRQATSTIPIVMVHAGDPVSAGLIASLARPGGNVTGTTNLLLGGKQVELIRELVPRAIKLAMLVNPSNAGTRNYVADAMETCRNLNCGITVAEVTRDEDFPTAFGIIRNMRPDALLVMDEALIGKHRTEVIAFAASARLPACYGQANMVRDGGLVSTARFFRTLCYGGRIRGQDSQGSKACGSAGRTANEIRACHQFEDSPSARSDNSPVSQCAC